jgi:anti-sigma factor RsiW
VTCSEIIEAFCDYLGDELEVTRRETLELHLTTCDNCTFYLESYRHTVTITRKMTCGPLPPAFEARLRAALKDHLSE